MRLRDGWEAEASNWEAWARTPGHDHYFWRFNWPAFVALLPAPGARTLDLGCGEGRGGRWLAEHGHHVVGVDAAPSMVRLAREAGGYEDIVEADAAALPFADASFDLVCAFMTLHDMDDFEDALTEVRRVLVPGGRLAAAIVHPVVTGPLGSDAPDAYFVAHRYAERLDRDGLEMTFHSIHRPIEDYAAALRRNGLLIEDLREPAPSAQDVREQPNLAKATERPAFLHLLAVRS